MARPPIRLPDRPELEDDLAKDVAEYLSWAWPEHLPWWHTPNGGKREQVVRTDRRTGKTYRFSPEAAKLKKMGVLAGVPDLTFIMPNGQAAFIELKVGDNDLSDEQIALRKRLLACNCGYKVAWSVDEVQTICRAWLAAYGLAPRAVFVPNALPLLRQGAR